jgi:hypothetical protein
VHARHAGAGVMLMPLTIFGSAILKPMNLNHLWFYASPMNLPSLRLGVLDICVSKSGKGDSDEELVLIVLDLCGDLCVCVCEIETCDSFVIIQELVRCLFGFSKSGIRV